MESDTEKELELQTWLYPDETPDVSYLEQTYDDLESVPACRVCGAELNLEPHKGEPHEPELETVAEKYRRQDAERLAAFNAGEWEMFGVLARATITITRAGYVDRRIVLDSPGLWGVESDSDRSYIEETAREQADELAPELEALGFTAEEIAAAIAAAWPAKAPA